MKKWIVSVWLVLIFAAIGSLFWYNELVYQLPTPIPGNYKPVATGQFIPLTNQLNSNSGKPVLLHFFNPNCPCSRFNMASFKALVKKYNTKVNFAIVVMSDKNYTAKEIQDKFDLDIPVLFDASIAKACGVYSTPQAVLLNTNHQLFYRGNYNRSRYCTDEKTSYAKIAIDNMLDGKQNMLFNALALRAYGCKLPNCTQQ